MSTGAQHESDDLAGEASAPHGAALDEQALHARLLAGDPTAPADLAETYLPRLVARLGRYYKNVDPQLLESAAIDAVLDLAMHPHRYDPARGRLESYLFMAARRDLLNALQRTQRRAAHERPLTVIDPSAGNVELASPARNLRASEADDPLELLIQQEAADPRLMAAIREQCDEREWAVFQLMLDGEDRTAAYAQVLGITHLSPREQAQEVKRVKERLKKRARRLVQRLGVGGEP
ncbi:MAG TPA: sigma factor [Chloroflexota bacterium]|nr:sigma factor [Chloroflexota bacterium]